MPEANAPALAALEKAVALKARASAKERALIEALEKRYSADPKVERAALDAAYADAMQEVARALPGRRHDPYAVRRERDGHPAVGLLGARRRQAEGPRRRDRRARSRRCSSATRSMPARSISTSTRSRPRPRPSGRCRMPTAWPRSCPAPATSCTCRRTSTTGSASTAIRSTPTSARSQSTSATSRARPPIRSTRAPTTRTTSTS